MTIWAVLVYMIKSVYKRLENVCFHVLMVLSILGAFFVVQLIHFLLSNPIPCPHIIIITYTHIVFIHRIYMQIMCGWLN